MIRPSSKHQALTRAAERYEESRVSGACRSEAFEDALRQYRAEIGVKHGARWAARKAALPVPVTVPIDVTALVAAAIQAHVGVASASLIHRDMLAGRRYKTVTDLRAEIGYVLHEMGYGDAVIGKAIGVDRTTVISARQRFEARLDSDEVLRARVARMVGEEGKAA